jgi:hypothetical protein
MNNIVIIDFFQFCIRIVRSTRSCWIRVTKISMTNINFFKLNFQTCESEEELKLVLRLKFTCRGGVAKGSPNGRNHYSFYRLGYCTKKLFFPMQL